MCEVLRVKLDRMKDECDKLAAQLNSKEDAHALLCKKYQLLQMELDEVSAVSIKTESCKCHAMIFFFCRNLCIMQTPRRFERLFLCHISTISKGCYIKSEGALQQQMASSLSSLTGPFSRRISSGYPCIDSKSDERKKKERERDCFSCSVGSLSRRDRMMTHSPPSNTVPLVPVSLTS